MKEYIKIIGDNEVCSKDIKYVTFILENCEYIKIPVENFSTLNIDASNHEGAVLECVIKKMNDIEYRPFTNDWNPFTRLSMLNDIASIELEFTNGTRHSIQPYWRGTDTNNYCQITHVISWDKISITICEENAMKKMRARCGTKADRILEIIYEDFAINSCGECYYKIDCDKLRTENNVNICGILEIMKNN